MAFLLFYPMTAGFAGDLDEVVKALEQMPAERLAGLLAVSLDVADEAQAAVEMSGDEFSARVLALSVPAESKVAILDLYHRPEPVLNQAAFYLSKTIRLLRQERKAMEVDLRRLYHYLAAGGAGTFPDPYLQSELPARAAIFSPSLPLWHGYQPVGDASGAGWSGAGVLRYPAGSLAGYAGLQPGTGI